MLDNVNQHAVVAHSYYCRLRVLQLDNILLIFVYFRFIYLPKLILIAPTKRLAYLNPANPYGRVSVA